MCPLRVISTENAATPIITAVVAITHYPQLHNGSWSFRRLRLNDVLNDHRVFTIIIRFIELFYDRQWQPTKAISINSFVLFELRTATQTNKAKADLYCISINRSSLVNIFNEQRVISSGIVCRLIITILSNPTHSTSPKKNGKKTLSKRIARQTMIDRYQMGKMNYSKHVRCVNSESQKRNLRMKSQQKQKQNIFIHFHWNCLLINSTCFECLERRNKNKLRWWRIPNWMIECIVCVLCVWRCVLRFSSLVFGRRVVRSSSGHSHMSICLCMRIWWWWLITVERGEVQSERNMWNE